MLRNSFSLVMSVISKIAGNVNLIVDNGTKTVYDADPATTDVSGCGPSALSAEGIIRIQGTNLSNLVIKNPNAGAAVTDAWQYNFGLPYCHLDTDGDGIQNICDKDDDGDGCPTAVEGGAKPTIPADSVVGGPYGANGLANKLENNDLFTAVTSFTSTYIAYGLDSSVNACANCDNDSIPNIFDIDDDNDGVLDAVEQTPSTPNWTNMTNGASSGTGTLNSMCGSNAFTVTTTTNVVAGMSNSVTINNTATSTGTDQCVFSTSNYSPKIESANTIGFNFQGAVNLSQPAGRVCINFTEPVTDPILYFSNIDWAQWDFTPTTGLSSLERTAGNTLFEVNGKVIRANTGVTSNNFLTCTEASQLPANGGYGSVRLKGTFTQICADIYKRSVAGGSLDVTAFSMATDVHNCDSDALTNACDPDSDNDGCNDAVESGAAPLGSTVPLAGPYGMNGLVNALENKDSFNAAVTYFPTYGFATDSLTNACLDCDGDGVPNLSDADDDNDGVPDAIEAPSCYKTEAEARDVVAISSDLLINATNVLNNAIDSNLATLTTFNPITQAIAGKTVYQIQLNAPMTLSSIKDTMNSTASFLASGATYKVQASNDGGTWTDVSSTLTAPATAAGNVLNISPLTTTQPYRFYRILGISGNTAGGNIREIVPIGSTTIPYNPSANPKAGCSVDTDGDGKPNTCDLDSDGDGCPDKLEGGVIKTVPADSTVAGPYGTNGLANSLETATDNGIVNYTNSYKELAIVGSINACDNCDNDSIPNSFDIDDDNDGILDSVETGCPAPAAGIAPQADKINYSTGGYNVYTIGNNTNGLGYQESGFQQAVSALGSTLSDPALNWPAFTSTSGGSGTMSIASSGTLTISQPSSAGAPALTTSDPQISGNGTSPNGIALRNAASSTAVAAGATITSTMTWPSSSNVKMVGFDLVDIGDWGTNGENNINVTIKVNGTELWYFSNSSVGGATTGSATIFNTNGGTSQGNITIGENTEDFIGIISNIPITSVEVVINYPSGGTAPDLQGFDNLIVGPACLPADTDGDGIPNTCDLDSDGDGCPDKLEAGVITILPADSTVAGPYGNNGLANSLENNDTKNATTSYTNTYTANAVNPAFNACANCDNDSIPNSSDIDDDNDGILDSIEMTCNAIVNGDFVGNNTVGWTFTGTAGVQQNRLYFNAGNTAVNGTATQTLSTASGQPLTLNYLTGSAGTGGSVGVRVDVIDVATNKVLATKTVLQSGTTTANQSISFVTEGTSTKILITDVSPTPANVDPYVDIFSLMYCDTDKDGIPNSCDKDSDGDGCPDATESGLYAKLPSTDTVPAPYGNNGLANSIENNDTETATTSYLSTYASYALDSALNACTNCDSDSIPNLIDIDDDNDGVLDTVENGNSCLNAIWNYKAYDNFVDAGAFTCPASPSGTVIGTGVKTGMNFLGTGAGTLATLMSSAGITYTGTNDANRWMVEFTHVIQPGEEGLLSMNFGDNADILRVFNNSNAIYCGGFPNIIGGSASGSFKIGDTLKIYFGENDNANTKININFTLPNGCYSWRIDTDKDGIPNSCDRDSDGDGCPDAFESGVYTKLPYPSDSVSAPYGNNGLANSLENNDTKTATTSYTNVYTQFALDSTIDACDNCDNDSIPNIYDLDDDNDGVLDAIEGTCSPSFALKDAGGTFGDIAGTATKDQDPGWPIPSDYNFISGQNTLANQYAVMNNAGANATWNHSLNYWDHVYGATTGSATDGFLAVNGSSVRDVFYSSKFTLSQAQNIDFGFSLTNANIGTTGAPVRVTMRLRNAAGVIVDTVQSNAIPSGVPPLTWYNTVKSKSLPAGDYTLELVNDLTTVSGNDFAIDNILVRPAGKSLACVDSDNDGITNSCDPDSDNDGCNDAVEAGSAPFGSTIPLAAPYGANGLIDALETNDTKTATTTYTNTFSLYAKDSMTNYCNDCDNDGISNLVDIDDDNDGILDSIEGGLNAFLNADLATFTAGPVSNATSTTLFSNWTVVSAGRTAGDINSTGGAAVISQDGGTVKLSQTVTADGYTNPLSFDYNWTEAAAPSNFATLLVQVGGVTYARISTSQGTAGKALITYFNGATGSPDTMSASTALKNIKINLPGAALTSGAKNVVFEQSSTGVSDNITIDNFKWMTLKDTDKDGILNSCDLDSDNDSCSDAFEAGATTNLSSSYSFPAPYGNNGMTVLKETNDFLTAGMNYTPTYSKAIDSLIKACCTANAGRDTTVCSADTTAMRGSGVGMGYIWTPLTSNPGTATLQNDTLVTTKVYGFTAPGVYKFKFGSGTCFDTMQITVLQSPTAILSNNGPICSGANVTLTVSGVATTYTINPGSLTGPTNIISPTVTTLYTVNATAANGCTFMDTTLVKVNPLPTKPTLSLVQPTCAVNTGSITVTAPAAGAGLSFSKDGTDFSNVTGIFNTLTAATYNITVKDSNGCKDTTNGTIILLPNLPAAPTTTLTHPTCTKDTGSIVITAPLGAGLTYSINGTTYQAGTGFYGLTAGNYTVTAKNSAGCVGAVSNVTINPQPATPVPPTITPTATAVCTNVSSTLTASGCSGKLYWYLQPDTTNPIDSTTSYVVNKATAGAYLYAVKCLNLTSGCISNASSNTTVTVSNPPSGPTISVSKDSVCAGDTINLTGLSCNGATDTLKWSKNGSPLANGLSIFDNPAVGSHTYTAVCNSATAGSCVSAATSLTVVVSALPSTPTLSATPDSICLGTSATLTASGAGAGQSYVWSTAQTGSSISVSPTTTTGYTVKLKNDATGCESTTSLTKNVVVKPTPTTAPTASTSTPNVCQGDSTTLFSTACAVGNPIWYSDSLVTLLVGGTKVGPTATTKYFVRCEANGCNGPSTSTLVTVNPKPAKPTISSVQPSCPVVNGSITVTAPTGTGMTYSKDSGLTFPSTTGSFPNQIPGTYIVIAKSSFGCTSDTAKVILAQPNCPDTVVTPKPACPTCPVTACVVGNNLPAGPGSTTYSTCGTPTGYAAVGPNASGCVTYTPLTSPAPTGPAQTCIVACKNGVCDTTYVTIPKPVSPDTAVTPPPACSTCPVTACVVGDDIDTTAGTKTYSTCGTPPEYSASTIDSNGCITYTPNRNSGYKSGYDVYCGM